MTQEYTLENVNQEILKIAEQTGKPKEELQKKYEEIFKSVSGRKEERKHKKAITKLKATVDASFRSNAATYDFILVGRSPPFNIMKKKMLELRNAYEENPSIFISGAGTEKVRFEEGSEYPIFVDNVEELAGGKQNPNFGKDIPSEKYVSNLIVAVKKPNVDQNWMPGTLTLWEELALSKDIPDPGCSFSARANGKFNQQKGEYELRGGSPSVTKFENVEKLTAGEWLDVVESSFQDRFKYIEELYDDLEATKDDQKRFVIVDGGAVSFLGQAKKDDNLKILTITDETQKKGEGISVFLDPDTKHWVDDLSVGDLVTIVGRHNGAVKRDAEGNETDEPTVTINAYAVVKDD